MVGRGKTEAGPVVSAKALSKRMTAKSEVPTASANEMPAVVAGGGGSSLSLIHI